MCWTFVGIVANPVRMVPQQAPSLRAQLLGFHLASRAELVLSRVLRGFDSGVSFDKLLGILGSNVGAAPSNSFGFHTEIRTSSLFTMWRILSNDTPRLKMVLTHQASITQNPVPANQGTKLGLRTILTSSTLGTVTSDGCSPSFG